MESTVLSNFAIIGLVSLLAAISPGPDFVIVSKNSLAYSRKSGLYTALGVSLGIFLHIAYCLIGIGYAISESNLLFNCVKYAGAAYLIYIGIKSLSAVGSIPMDALSPERSIQSIPDLKAIQIGFLTNALNPKATLFFLSVFSQVITPDTKLVTQLFYALEIWLIVLLWFCLLALLLTHENIKKKLVLVQSKIDKCIGVLLLIFGLRIAFS